MKRFHGMYGYIVTLALALDLQNDMLQCSRVYVMNKYNFYVYYLPHSSHVCTFHLLLFLEEMLFRTYLTDWWSIIICLEIPSLKEKCDKSHQERHCNFNANLCDT